jgi:hypothetical protein
MAKKRRTERMTLTNEYDDRFKTCLSAFSNVCAFCHVFDMAEDQSHPIKQCPVLKKSSVEEPNVAGFFRWRQRLRYDKKIHRDTKVCYLCHSPQGEKDALHPSFTGNKSDCPYPDIIPPIAYSIVHHKDLKQEAASVFSSVDWSDDACVLAWLTGPPVKGHSTNLSALFLWYAQR